MTISTGLLALIVVFIFVGSPRRLDINVFVAGMALLVLAGLLGCVDAWRPRQPGVFRDGARTVVGSTRTPGVMVLVGLMGLAVMVGSQVVREGFQATISGQPYTAVSIVLVPVGVVWAIATLLRPNRLDVGPRGVTVRLGARTRQLAWSEVTAVELAGRGQVVRLRRQQGRAVQFSTRYLALGATDLHALLESQRQAAVGG